MSRSLRRGVLAAFLTVVLVPLSACAAGLDAETTEVKPDNPSVTVGDIEIHNAVVITSAAASGPAGVSASLVNNGDSAQTLDSVTLQGASKPAKLSPAPGSKGGAVVVPAGGSVLLGGSGNPSAVVEGGMESLRLGDFQKLTFKFSETGNVTLDASVVPAEGYYKPYGPSAGAATPPTSGKPGGAASGSASPGATGAAGPGSKTSQSEAASPNASASGSRSAAGDGQQGQGGQEAGAGH